MSTRRRSLRGIAVRALVFLLLGAVVNVGVAWGSAWFDESMQNDISMSFFRPASNGTTWRSTVEDRYCGARVFKSICTTSESVAYQWCGLWKYDNDPWSDSDLPYWVRVVKGAGAPCAHQGEHVILVEIGHGWPTVAMVHHFNTNVSDAFSKTNPLPPAIDWGVAFGTPPRELPLLPIWPGFAINTIFYAAILWLLFVFPFALRRWRRIRRGLCATCAYPVGAGDLCTECGAAISVRSLPR